MHGRASRHVGAEAHHLGFGVGLGDFTGGGDDGGDDGDQGSFCDYPEGHDLSAGLYAGEGSRGLSEGECCRVCGASCALLGACFKGCCCKLVWTVDA